MDKSTREQVEAALAGFTDPHLGTDLLAAKAVKTLELADGKLKLAIELGYPAARWKAQLARELEDRLRRIEGIEECELEVTWRVQTHAVQPSLKPIAGVRNIIAVASGKGGVGKSTTAVNLALALAAEGASVGLLDADIYGPSQPRMLGVRDRQPTTSDGKTMNPIEALGVKCMSIGFLIGEDEPMVWRGPMVTQALSQLIGETNWGELDYLIVDMPPGTGDIQLTLSQRVPVSGAVIITTPQDIALIDARKGLRMFQKVNVQVLGVIENMSTHICSQCGHEEPIFGSGGGERMARDYEVPLLGALPLDLRIREEADSGHPSVVADPDGEIAARYRDIARRMAARLSHLARDYSRLFPKITVEDST
jgi:ATP-binding protein involved in chromosome partitioning